MSWQRKLYIVSTFAIGAYAVAKATNNGWLGIAWISTMLALDILRRSK